MSISEDSNTSAPNDIFSFHPDHLSAEMSALAVQWNTSQPFKHIVIDNFLPEKDANILSTHFPLKDNRVWLDWRERSKFQYGKQGPGNSDRFDFLDWRFLYSLQQFNSDKFLRFLENLTSIQGLLPDPYFTGGGMHQILRGGILDIHTDFNYYKKLNIYRRLNVLFYLTPDWKPEYGGELELWDRSPKDDGKCFASIPPILNRLVVFETDKTSFHGHPKEWMAPDHVQRRSIAIYYYTSAKVEQKLYDENTDFQDYVSKTLPDTE